MKYFTESYLVEKYLPNEVITPDNLIKLLHDVLSDDDWDVLSRHGEIQKSSEKLEERYILTPASWFFTDQMYGRVKSIVGTHPTTDRLSAQELSTLYGISVDGIARMRYWLGAPQCMSYKEMCANQDKIAQENMISTLGIDEYVKCYKMKYGCLPKH